MHDTGRTSVRVCIASNTRYDLRVGAGEATSRQMLGVSNEQPWWRFCPYTMRRQRWWA